MSLNDLLAKIPKPILVLGILSLALAFIVFKNPMTDECEVQAKNFDRNTKGLLFPVKVKNKIQFAKLTPLRDICRDGNSIGACSDYLEGLRKVSNEFKLMSDHCKIKYAELNEGFLPQIRSAIKVMALVAWGEKPPAGPAERMGWLTEPDLRSFCHLKKSYTTIAGEESYQLVRDEVYREYPDQWAESSLPNAEAEADNRLPENRPKAMKTALNPKGKFTSREVFERSLFSIRCDLYL